MLTNMFDPTKETEGGWDQEIRDDVIEECNKYGGVLQLYVDMKESSSYSLIMEQKSIPKINMERHLFTGPVAKAI